MPHSYLQMVSMEPGSKLMALAAMFESGFTIDWLQELSKAKASEILRFVESAIAEGTLEGRPSGVIAFSDEGKQKYFRSLLTPDEQRQSHRAIADILLAEAEISTSALQRAAQHLLQIENTVQGCVWLLKAGNVYVRSYRYKEALACYKKILNDLISESTIEAVPCFIDTAIAYSRISDAEADLSEVIAILKTALSKIGEAGDPIHRARLEMHLAKNEWLLSNFESALEHFSNAQAIAARCEGMGLRHSLAGFMTFFLFVKGRPKDVIRYYEEFMPEVEKYPKSRFPMLSATVVGLSYAATGQITKGMGMLDAIDVHERSKGNDYVASFTSYAIGVVLHKLGRNDEAISYFHGAVDRGERAPNFTPMAASLAYLAAIFSEMGDGKASERHYSRFLDLNRKVKIDRSVIPCFMELGWLVEQGKLPPLPELSFKEEVERSIASQSILMKGIAYRYKALSRKLRGEHPASYHQDFELSCRLLSECGGHVEAAATRFELARVHLEIGDEGKARELVRQATEPLDARAAEVVPDDLLPLLNDFRGDRRLLDEIMKLSQELVGIREPREVLRKIISTAFYIMGAERGAIFVPQPENAALPLILQAAKNLTEEDVIDKSFSRSIEIIRTTATTGEPCIRWVEKPDETSNTGDSRVRSCICLPMKLRGDVIGVLYFDNRLLSSTFKDSALDVLGYFAALAAIAMDNARAYEKIQTLNEKLVEEKQYYREQHLECIHFEEFVGKSRAIMKVLSNVQDVAETVSNVLILGETGVGKELVARSIHRLSLRKNMPFIRVNCSAFPEGLIASELFGYEKGAFTGASDRRIGRFELADKGTMFLDEIGDIPLEVQVRILRVLQSKEFERLGGNETIRSDFRLIAATNQDLQKAVRNGKFREDLFYRLNVFPITVPPLRERRDDIPLLAQYFLEIYGNKMGKPNLRFSTADINRMVEYDWAGNVRELENLIERGTILSAGERFVMPELNRGSPAASQAREAVTLQENERRHIMWAIRIAGGKIRGKNGAAEILDIHPNTLYGRMRKLRIPFGRVASSD